VAKLAEGKFLCIEQSKGAKVISTPYDDKLASLSSELNKTYIPFGQSGQAMQQSQMRQDTLSAKISSYAAASRAEAKASAVYNASSWDLVDASKEKNFKLESIPKEHLPQNMQAMSLEQKKAYLKEVEKKRKEIQKQIQELSRKRQEYIRSINKGQAQSGSDTFDQAVLSALREQAKKKGFTLAH